MVTIKDETASFVCEQLRSDANRIRLLGKSDYETKRKIADIESAIKELGK